MNKDSETAEINSHDVEELYSALEHVLEKLSKSTDPQQKLANELGTLLVNHYEEYGRREQEVSDDVEIEIKFKGQDNSLELTSKQKRAYQLCKKLTSERDREKRLLVQKLLSKGVYSSQHQAKKALKLLLRLDGTPLESQGQTVSYIGTGENSEK